MAVLDGSLEVFALPDIFRLLAQNKVTGALKVVRESGDGIIYFREGEVYFAFSSLTREFLGQRLVNAKLITQGQLLRILDEQKRSGNRRVGDLLVEKGYISEELLDTFIKEQIQDAIFNLLQWDLGTFSFEVGEVSPQEVGLSVSVENLIMESSRRIEEWEVIQRKIPSLDVIVRMAPTPPEDVMEINIKPEEWTLLVLADGRRSVRDIAAATERSEFEACKIIYGLVTAGLLDVATGPVGARRAAEPSRVSPRDLDELVTRREPRAEERPSAAAGRGGAVAAVGEVEAAQAAEWAAQATRGAEATDLELEPSEPELVAAEPPPVEEPVAEPAPARPEPIASSPDGQESPTPLRAKPAREPKAPAVDVAEPAAAAKSAPATPKRPGDPTISKEMLLRLIAGVRNL